MDGEAKPAFNCEPARMNLFRNLLRTQQGCHGGEGSVRVFRAYERALGCMHVDWIDVVVIPPQASIGKHVHGDDIEWYIVLTGAGRMWFAGRWVDAAPGDVFINPRYGEHGLTNESSMPIHLLVFQTSHAQEDRS